MVTQKGKNVKRYGGLFFAGVWIFHRKKFWGEFLWWWRIWGQ